MELRVNEAFAREYERRKRREELARLREQEQQERRRTNADPRPSGCNADQISHTSDGVTIASSDDDESTNEDDLGMLLTKRLDTQWARTLELIRRRDPCIYDPNFRFYDEDETTETGSEPDSDTSSSEGDEPVAGYDYIALSAEKETAIYLDQYARDGLLHEMKTRSASPSGSSSSELGTEAANTSYLVSEGRSRVPVYDAEQAKIRQAFLEQAARETIRSDDAGSVPEAVAAPESSDQSGDELFKMRTYDERFDVLGASPAATPLKATAVPEVRTESNESKFDEDLHHSYLETETAAEKEAFLYDYLVNNRWLGSVHATLEKATKVDPNQASGSANPVDEDEVFLEKQDKFEYAHNFRFEEPNADVVPSHPRHVEGSLRRPSSKQEARKRQREAKMAREEVKKRQRLETLRRLRNTRLAERAEQKRRIARAAGLQCDADKADADEGRTSERTWLERMVALADSDTDFDASKFDAAMRTLFEREDYQNAPDDSWEPTSRTSPEDAGSRPRSGPDRQQSNGRAAAVASPECDDDDDDSELDSLYREDLLANTRFHYRRVEPRSFGLTAEEMLDMDERALNTYASIKYIQPFRPIETLPKRLRKLLRGNASMQRYRRKQACQQSGSRAAISGRDRQRGNRPKSSAVTADKS